MTLDEKNKLKLEDFVNKLKDYRGSHTELISVYVPAGYTHFNVSNQLEAEKGTAKNIKSTSTRKNVIDALERIIRYLKGLKKTPENGLAIFCGNVSNVEGQTDTQLFDIEPPLPLKTRLYRCDKTFVLEPLEEMLEVGEVFGLLVMDRKEATIGMLEGKQIKVIEKMTSGVPSKVRAGGQCLAPDCWVSLNKENKNVIDLKVNDKIRALDFESNKIIFTNVKNKWEVIKNKILEIFVEDGESIISSLDHTFFRKSKGDIQEIIAQNLKNGDILVCSNNHDILELRIIDIKEREGNFKLVDIETEIKNFFANGILVHNSSQRFHRITEGLVKEFYKRIAERMKDSFFELPKLKGILIGGPIPTKDEFLEGKYLQTQLQEKVISVKDLGYADEHGLKLLVEASQDVLSEQEIIHEKKILEKFFNILGAQRTMAAYGYDDVKKALQYGAVDILILSKKVEKKVQKELTDMADSIGARVEIVSVETNEGEQFFNLSGIGAILRFAV
jgi:peptide subunit release factor 1 (eRF1)